MRRGTVISGVMHAALVLGVVADGHWPRSAESTTLELTEVAFVDGQEFDAMVSTAPVVQSDGPADLAPPSEGQAPNVVTPEDADAGLTAPDAVVAAAAPAPRADLPDFAAPPPPRNVPTEAPRMSIAEVPTPDALALQAPAPQSPPATQPLQPLASQAPTPEAAPKPLPPPEPEPAPEAETTPEPEPEPTTEVAEAQPDAPEGFAPQEAAIPAVKPAERAAAAAASRETQIRAEAEAETPTPGAETAATPEEPTQQAAAGGSSAQQGARLNRSERQGLSTGLGQFYRPLPGMDRGMAVRVEVKLDTQGQVVGTPEMIGAEGGNPAQQESLRRAAIRAVFDAARAGAFQKLPREKFGAWQTLIFKFTSTGIGLAS
ncbi:MAG: hypothetical protein AAF908_01800 [Pseudomonadota bacterium]